MKYSDVKSKKEKARAKGKSKTGLFLLILGLVLTSWFIYANRKHGSFSPISIVTSVAAADIKDSDGRTNVLILGSDKRTVGPVTSILTDTILVASIGRVDKDVVLISIPRDLWVKDSRGYQMKINEIYYYGGPEETQKVASDALGIPIHYFVVVNFELFKNTINLLDGINITVDRSFTDYRYPVEGKENAPDDERYEIVRFEAGPQTMDGDRALKFARSRQGDHEEGTDFARSRRQQKVIAAIKDKALSLQTLINPQKLKDLYDLYSENVETNVDLSTIQNFYLLSQQIQFDKVVSIVLDDSNDTNVGGLLYAPEDRTLYGGRYVLIPRTGDYSQIHAYVQKYLFGER